MNLSIYEQLQNVDKVSNKQERLNLLQQYAKESSALKIILDLTFNPKWNWLLPSGKPPYNASPKEADLQNVLKLESRRLQYFVNTPQGNAVKPLRREVMFIELLESVDHNDAKLLIAVKEKTLPFKNVTKKLVKEAFPDETQSW